MSLQPVESRFQARPLATQLMPCYGCSEELFRSIPISLSKQSARLVTEKLRESQIFRDPPLLCTIGTVTSIQQSEPGFPIQLQRNRNRSRSNGAPARTSGGSGERAIRREARFQRSRHALTRPRARRTSRICRMPCRDTNDCFEQAVDAKGVQHLKA